MSAQEQTKPQSGKDKLEASLLAVGGKRCLIPEIEEDLDALLSRGEAVDTAGLYRMLGRPSQCHENSARCWDANRDHATLMTGYALSDDGVWRPHSWVLDGKGVIVETTEPQRQCYFGFKMTEVEADQFYFDNAW